MSQSGEQTERYWHLDKRVPLALIVTIMIQTSAAIWWAATITGRVSNNEQSVIRIETMTNSVRDASQAQAVQLSRIEEQVRALRIDITRLISVIERTDR